MKERKDYVEQCLDPSKRNMDRNRGLQANAFGDALKRAAIAAEPKEINKDIKNTPDENSGQ